MSGSTYGKYFTFTTWGESHGKALGAVVDGCPAGIPLEESDIQAYLDRRKPGQSRYTTKRTEDDAVEILSGVFEGRTTGTPISMIVRNKDQRSRDYSEIASYTVPAMPTTVLTSSTVFGTIGAEAALPAGKPSAAWLPEPLP